MQDAIQVSVDSTLSNRMLPCVCPERNVKPQEGKESIKPEKASRKDKAKSNNRLELINQTLNPEQQLAVRNFLEGAEWPLTHVIFGPPGTGKTMTLVETVLQLLRTQHSSRLCVCAPANFAADLLCSGIADGGVGPDAMWRLNDPRRMHASVKDDIIGRVGGSSRDFCTFSEEYRLFDLHPSPDDLRVVVTTCGSAAMLREVPLLAHRMKFTHILVDEAGQAPVPETLIPLTLATERTQIMLCGDPRQLGPIVHSSVAANHGLSKSLLERYMDMESTQRSCLVTKLVRNYRSSQELLELPSKLFYGRELIASAQPETVVPPSWEEMSGQEFPILFYGVKGKQMREGESPSYFNPVEAVKLVSLLEGLLKVGHVKPGDIGVMAPYRNQVQKLRLLLRERNLASVRVGTVDDYQGQEEKIIFISTVLTKPQSAALVTEDGMKSSVGFLGNSKRFNVAITRAKALLVVVGHPLVLLEDKNWCELLKYCLARDSFRGAGSDFVTQYTRGATPSLFTGLTRSEDGSPHEAEGIVDNGSNVEDLQIRKAIERIAELSLLGMGDKDICFPECLDDMYSAFSEDLEWRVVL